MMSDSTVYYNEVGATKHDNIVSACNRHQRVLNISYHRTIVIVCPLWLLNFIFRINIMHSTHTLLTMHHQTSVTLYLTSPGTNECTCTISILRHPWNVCVHTHTHTQHTHTHTHNTHIHTHYTHTHTSAPPLHSELTYNT